MTSHSFINHLVRPEGSDFCNRISFDNGLFLSIQCHGFAYCKPRKGGLPLSEYTRFEVAVMDKEGRFILEEDLGNIAKIVGSTDGDQVWSYMTKENVQKMFDFIKSFDVPEGKF